jgi:hypothetical protein
MALKNIHVVGVSDVLFAGALHQTYRFTTNTTE